MYFNPWDSSSQTFVAKGCLITDAASHVFLTSARLFGETVGTSAGEAAIQYTSGGGTEQETVTPAKSNSRSAAPAGTYGSQVTGGSGSGNFAVISIANFSHVGLIFGRRYAPVAIKDESLNLGGTGTFINTWSVSFDEGAFVPNRFGSRRSRGGYFFRFGNEIHHHQKTGSGAFSQIAPHFDNDITWVNPFAWKLGHVQSDVWNMQLFNPQLAFPPLFHHGPPHNNTSLRM